MKRVPMIGEPDDLCRVLHRADFPLVEIITAEDEAVFLCDRFYTAQQDFQPGIRFKILTIVQMINPVVGAQKNIFAVIRDDVFETPLGLSG